MDVLIAIATIAIFIIRAVKKAQEKATEQAKNFEPPKAQPQPETKAKPTVKQTVQRTTRSMEYSKQEIGKKLPKEQLIRPEYVSAEGSVSQEGKCIEPDANHCAVEHFEDTVYANEITDEAPVKFDREHLVQGIIMAEILSKPKWSE